MTANQQATQHCPNRLLNMMVRIDQSRNGIVSDRLNGTDQIPRLGGRDMRVDQHDVGLVDNHQRVAVKNGGRGLGQPDIVAQFREFVGVRGDNLGGQGSAVWPGDEQHGDAERHPCDQLPESLELVVYRRFVKHGFHPWSSASGAGSRLSAARSAFASRIKK